MMTVNDLHFASQEQRIRWARTTGWSLLLMAALGGYAYGFVHSRLHIPGDAEATFTAIVGNYVILSTGILAWLGVVILDIVVSLGAFVLYRHTNWVAACWVSGLRIAYTIVLALAVAQLAGGAYAIDPATALLAFERFEFTWSTGLIVFGIHLFGLAYLTWKSELPIKTISILLGLGGLGYLWVEGTEVLLGHNKDMTNPLVLGFAIPMILGELLFAVSLIVRGRFRQSTF